MIDKIENTLFAPPAKDVPRPDLEQLYITPHDSNTYDQLADPGAHDDDHD